MKSQNYTTKTENAYNEVSLAFEHFVLYHDTIVVCPGAGEVLQKG